LAEEQFSQQEVRRAILQLSEDQQQVILMSFIEGFEYSEIAAALNKSEGNIRVIVHRALKRMREILGKAGN
jgi:RNA polymerase sigma-70 factor (ECF subfamily)